MPDFLGIFVRKIVAPIEVGSSVTKLFQK